MKQAHLFITGSVQGVGFRQFVKWQARKLGLKGWVKNLPDGRVEAVVVGENEHVDQLIAHCRTGPFLAKVKLVEVGWEESLEEYSTFEVIR